jgi:hypothetical protein
MTLIGGAAVAWPLSLCIFGREIHEHADASHPAGWLLRTSRERPGSRRAAERG